MWNRVKKRDKVDDVRKGRRWGGGRLRKGRRRKRKRRGGGRGWKGEEEGKEDLGKSNAMSVDVLP